MTTSSKVKSLKEQLVNLGPMLPGTISRQWNVCGKAGCRCKDPKKPQKHGPYYQLSFSVGKRSSSMFLKKEDLPAAREAIVRYQTFRQLCADLAAAYVAEARLVGIAKLVEQDSRHG